MRKRLSLICEFFSFELKEIGVLMFVELFEKHTPSGEYTLVENHLVRTRNVVIQQAIFHFLVPGNLQQVPLERRHWKRVEHIEVSAITLYQSIIVHWSTCLFGTQIPLARPGHSQYVWAVCL